ncbi:MAG: hypothetical protein ACKVUS_11210 [Saprospiraceae bacterium]
MTANLSTDILKSALIELAQSDRAFFVSLIDDLLNGNAVKSVQKPVSQRKKTKFQPVNSNHKVEKINPPYRKNVEEMRAKYAMDKTVLLQLQDLFNDAPPAEEFLQSAST